VRLGWTRKGGGKKKGCHGYAGQVKGLLEDFERGGRQKRKGGVVVGRVSKNIGVEKRVSAGKKRVSTIARHG